MLDGLVDELVLKGPRVLDDKIIDLKNGKEVTFDEMIGAVKNSDVVYFGEKHGVKAILSMQLKVLEALYRNNPDVSVGMEMFNYKQQHLIDGYLEGKMDLEGLIKEYSKGKERFDLNHYGKILDYARDHDLEVLGLIIPRQFAAMVTRNGLEAIDDEDLIIKSTDMDLSNEAYSKWVKEAIRESTPMMGAGLKPDDFVKAQAVKDETMGKNIAKYFAKRDRKTPQMLAIMGSGHCNYRFGVPDRAKKWARKEGITIKDSVIIAEKLDESVDKNRLVNMLRDGKFADFVWFKWTNT
jgi:uncharacterized iron-regulated protein